MSASTTQLALVYLIQNQAQPHVTLNTAMDRLDGAIAGRLAVTLTTNRTVTTDEGQTHSILDFSGSLGAGATITLPTLTRCWVIRNTSGQTLTIKTAGQAGPPTLATGKVAIFATDGTNAFQVTAAL